jgi:hypothetical protein
MNNQNTYNNTQFGYPGQYHTTNQQNPITGIPIQPVQNYDTSVQETDPLKKPIFDDTSYQNSKCNDLFFLFLFLAQLIFIIAYGIVQVENNNVTFSSTSQNSSSINSTNTYTTNDNFGTYIAISSLASIVFSYVIMGIMKTFPEQFIKVANITLIIFNLLGAILCFATGFVFGGVLMTLQVAIFAYWYYIAQIYIPFSSMLLKTSTEILRRNLAIFLIPVFGLLFDFIYCIFMLCSISPFVNQLNNGNSSGFVILLFIMCFFWTQQVIMNTVHVTVAGVVGQWYFRNTDTTSLVWRAFTRSITTSFGSICFGSLIVAIIKTIHYIVRMARRNDNNLVVCCADCILGCLEGIVEYFNEYAYAYVGIYGISYIESAKRTWNLAKDNIITALFNDNLIYPVLMFATLFVGIFTGFVCWIISGSLYITISCAFVGFAIASIITNIVHSSIVALFVCYLDNTSLLAVLVPELDRLINQHATDARTMRERSYASNVIIV